MERVKLRKRAFVALMAASLLSVSSMDAQIIINRGLLENPYMESSKQGGGMLRSRSSSSTTGSFTHQTFGFDHGGSFTHQTFGFDHEGSFTHQTFGDTVPTGSGMFILLSAGLGYAATKRKKQNKKNQQKKNQIK